MTIPGGTTFNYLKRTTLLAVVSAAGFLATTSAALGATDSVSLDVPYVPTPQEVVNRMLEVAEVGPDDFIIDLGSGDGRIAIAAVKDHGAKGALGVDLNPQRIAEAKTNAEQAGVSDKVEFREQNLFDTDFSDATVVTMYLLPAVNMSLRPKVLDLKPGTRVVSHAFDMEDWESDHFERVNGRSIYLWIVPAKVDGRWKLEGPDGEIELQLTQEFQNVSGTAQVASGDTLPVTGKLDGTDIRLVIGEGDSARSYSGNIQGGSMLASTNATGASSGSDVQNWKGSRL